MNELVIKTQDLCKKYRNHYVVDHINMTIKKGDIYGFIGRNGAGKSTTLKMITGMIQPTQGTIQYFGSHRDERTSRRIGALIETPGLYPHLNAYDNMDIKATAMGTNNKETIYELLHLVKLDPKNKKTVKHFSMGMKQRLGIALALLGKPDFLILDEPINGLDPEGIRELREIIRYLNENRNMTILISSHILGELSKIATRYGIIRDGVLLEEISAQELQKKCQNYLSIQVDNVQKALPILEEKLHIEKYQVHEDNEIWIFENVDSKTINQTLALNNVLISSISYKNQDLENYFLDKIGGNPHD